MKNLVILFVVFFSLFLTSCSDVLDNSMVTNPVMEKTSGSGSTLTASPVYPYPYLYSFTQIKAVKYYSPEGQSSVEFILPDFEATFTQLYVVVTFNNNVPAKTYFIDQIQQNTFKIDGLSEQNLKGVSVFGFRNNSINEVISPLQNNTALFETSVNGWKVDNSKIIVDCGSMWPSNLKYTFAELTTKDGVFFVFLQKPYSSKFVIPEYGKYNVGSIRLFSYYLMTESISELE
jgi:hypothetical protein